MGQKVNPLGFRLGVIKDWNGRWYANKRSYAELLHEDLEIRKLIKQRFIWPVFPGLRSSERQTAARSAFILDGLA